jgi:hypothetical protein
MVPYYRRDIHQARSHDRIDRSSSLFTHRFESIPQHVRLERDTATWTPCPCCVDHPTWSSPKRRPCNQIMRPQMAPNTNTRSAKIAGRTKVFHMPLMRLDANCPWIDATKAMHLALPG